MVAEADESDASFLRLKPEIAVITNIEMDHHSRWGSVAELRAAFAEFADGRQRVAEFDARTRPGPAELAPRGSRPPQPAQRPRGAGGASGSPASTSTRRRRRSPTSPASGGGSS